MKFKVVVIASILMLCMFSCQKNEDPIVNPGSLEKSLDEERLDKEILEFESQTGIVVFYKPGNSELQTTTEMNHFINESDYSKSTITSIREQINKLFDIIYEYPEDFIEHINLEAIIFVKSSKFKWAGRVQSKTLAINGLSFLSDKTLIAHEIFHVFDPGLPIVFLDSEYEMNWNNLNPLNFEYGMVCHGSGLTIDPSFAFINSYSKCSPHEDRAVVFSFMLTKSTVLQNLTKNDSLLAGKTDFIKNLMSEFEFEF